MRRRLLYGGTVNLTLSRYSSTESAAKHTMSSFYVYNDGQLLKSSDVTVTSDAEFVSSCTYSSASAQVSVSLYANMDLDNSRSGTVVIKYKSGSVSYDITQNKGYITATNLTNQVSYSTASSAIYLKISDEYLPRQCIHSNVKFILVNTELLMMAWPNI